MKATTGNFETRFSSSDRAGKRNGKLSFSFGYGLITRLPLAKSIHQSFYAKNVSEVMWFRKGKSSSMAFPSTLWDRETRCRCSQTALHWFLRIHSLDLHHTLLNLSDRNCSYSKKIHSGVCTSWCRGRKRWLLETVLATLRRKIVKYFWDDFRIMGNMQDEAMAFMCKWKYD